jgi:hypothetical protein
MSRTDLLRLLDAVEKHERRAHSPHPEAADDDDLHATARSIREKLEATEKGEAESAAEQGKGPLADD